MTTQKNQNIFASLQNVYGWLQYFVQNYATLFSPCAVGQQVRTDFYTIHKAINELRSSVMDIYLLSRLFKQNFEPTTSTYSHISADIGKEGSKNVIILAGSFHTDVYRTFLTSIGFETKKNVDASKASNDMVDISSVSLPFF